MNIESIDEAAQALSYYENKLKDICREVSDPALMKLGASNRVAREAMQMAVDERNDYIQNLVHCVHRGVVITPNKYVFQQMHLYVMSELQKLQEMAQDNEVSAETRREIERRKNDIAQEERIMRSIGHGLYGLDVEKYEENRMIEPRNFRWLKEAMVLVSEIQRETEEIYEKEVAARSEG